MLIRLISSIHPTVIICTSSRIWIMLIITTQVHLHLHPHQLVLFLLRLSFNICSRIISSLLQQFQVLTIIQMEVAVAWAKNVSVEFCSQSSRHASWSVALNSKNIWVHLNVKICLNNWAYQRPRWKSGFRIIATKWKKLDKKRNINIISIVWGLLAAWILVGVVWWATAIAIHYRAVLTVTVVIWLNRHHHHHRLRRLLHPHL